MAVVKRPGAGNDAGRIEKRVELFYLVRPDDLHAEADVVGDALQVMEPVDVLFLERDADTAGGMPADVLAGQRLELRVEPVAVGVDLRKVVVTDEARALAGRVPRRTRRELALLDEQRIFTALFGQVVEQADAHDAAADDDDFCL